MAAMGRDMTAPDPTDEQAVLLRIRTQATAQQYRVSDHARGRLLEWDITPAEMVEAISTARVLENYPAWHIGPACLLYGTTAAGRPLHLVCSTTLPELVIITIYEPGPPKWITPTQRSRS
jgi:hypothetical protein